MLLYYSRTYYAKHTYWQIEWVRINNNVLWEFRCNIMFDFVIVSENNKSTPDYIHHQLHIQWAGFKTNWWLIKKVGSLRLHSVQMENQFSKYFIFIKIYFIWQKHKETFNLPHIEYILYFIQLIQVHMIDIWKIFYQCDALKYTQGSIENVQPAKYIQSCELNMNILFHRGIVNHLHQYLGNKRFIIKNF